MNIYGVYFICCKGDYINIVNEQLNTLINSGLYNKSKKIIIFINLCNNIIDLLKTFDIDNKFIYITTRKNLYEKFAINNYKKYIDDNEYYLYYFHTKGITKKKDIFHNIRKILNYYILTKYNICIDLLDTYDAVGCSLYLYPKLHFSGNFWWSKSTHLNTLKDIGNMYLDPEMYICSNKDAKYISLSQTSNNGDMMDLSYDDNTILQNLTSIPENNDFHKKLLPLCSKN